MVKFLLTFSIFFYSIGVSAQNLEFDGPQKLPTSINTDDEETMPFLSPDGSILYFTRFASAANHGGRYAGTDIWVSERKGSAWQKANNTTIPFNNDDNNAVIGTSDDGSTIYLIDSSPNKKMKGIYFSKHVKSVWRKPEFIEIPGIDNMGHIGFYVSSDFTVIIISMEGGDTLGEEDLYFSLKNGSGKWSKPKALGTTINTAGFEISPFLSNDKKRLYFSSNGRGGSGDADIFFSDRLYDSWEVWSAPKNLGEKINSPQFDAYFTIYGDSVCYFASNRSGAYSDLYKSIVHVDDGRLRQEKIDNMMIETKEMLDQLRSSTNAIAAEGAHTAGMVTLTFEDNSTKLVSSSKKLVDDFIAFMNNNPGLRAKLKYDGNATGNAKAAQILTQDRVRAIQQLLRTGGIIGSRLSVSPDLSSTAPSNILINTFKLQAE